ncbi:MAG: hypothetical protein CMI18_06050 [Opitutaceae bacterium]|nr:hypothetical protein [Opitutaceae bacterium]
MNRGLRYSSCSLLWLILAAVAWSMHHGSPLAGIIERFNEEDPALQYEARRELAKYVADGTAPGVENGAANVTRQLLNFLSKNGVSREAKKYIVRDLARVGTSDAVEPLAKVITGKDALIAEAGRQALEQIQGDNVSSVLKKLIKGAKETDDRQNYLRTLANRRESSNAGYFRLGLKSSDTVYAKESVLALSLLGDGGSVKALESAYKKGSSGSNKNLIENELLRADSVSDNFLLSVYENAGVRPNRQAALVKLVDRGHSQSDNLLRSSLADGDSDLRANAMRIALSKDKGYIVRSEVENFSNDEWRILLNNLSGFEGKGAEGLAHKAIDSGCAGVQVQALRALGVYGTGKSIDLLLAHFSSDNKELKQAATYAIARFPGSAMNSAISTLFNSDSADNKALAIEAMAYRNVPNAKNRLFRIVNGEDMHLVREALQTLSVTADEEDLYRLLFLSRRSEEEKSKIINGMLKKVTPQIGSRELQAKVAAL